MQYDPEKSNNETSLCLPMRKMEKPIVYLSPWYPNKSDLVAKLFRQILKPQHRWKSVWSLHTEIQ
jgi:hypothetical protein